VSVSVFEFELEQQDRRQRIQGVGGAGTAHFGGLAPLRALRPVHGNPPAGDDCVALDRPGLHVESQGLTVSLSGSHSRSLAPFAVR
jgi:hypothetical protein